MEIILLENIFKLGKIGEKVKIRENQKKNGFREKTAQNL